MNEILQFLKNNKDKWFSVLEIQEKTGFNYTSITRQCKNGVYARALLKEYVQFVDKREEGKQGYGLHSGTISGR